MIEGTTKSGFRFSISENVSDNMELIDAMADTMSDDGTRVVAGLSATLNILLGKNKKSLYDHLREKDGRVPVAKIEAEITEMFAAIKNSKNS